MVVLTIAAPVSSLGTGARVMNFIGGGTGGYSILLSNTVTTVYGTYAKRGLYRRLTPCELSEATTLTFNTDGTYVFKFESYGVEDAGTC